MNQSERRVFLIRKLLSEQAQYADMAIPQEDKSQRRLLRALMNVRPPKPIGDDFLRVQDEYLQAELKQRGVTDYRDLTPVSDGICLWQGDITTLQCGAIVNAANSGMTGCYVPCHACIDNCIHTFAGVQLRLFCHALMQQQGYDEPAGQAKITPAFNLPCEYVLHTVGPIIGNLVTQEDEALLASCYRSCLVLAAEKGIESVAFCCISTGEFRFPQRRAAEIAIRTVNDYKTNNKSTVKVIFNVFKDEDYSIYRELIADR